ncbi:anti-sigma factor family protein, partial [Mycobacterium colombiense]|uniref:anti-sigma factor family protein n=1 Tax=Mycobacterium colombiense TaxID=339268 RepID=UPI000AB44798
MDEMRTPVQDLGPPEDSYAMWDAAYVLGSLPAAQRREFETHMVHCPDCRAAVADLSGVPALLSQLDGDEVAAMDQSGPSPEMSPKLLPSLLATVRWRRRHPGHY